MINKILEYFGWGGPAGSSFGRGGKEVEYRYIYMLQDGSMVFSAVCAG